MVYQIDQTLAAVPGSIVGLLLLSLLFLLIDDIRARRRVVRQREAEALLQLELAEARAIAARMPVVEAEFQQARASLAAASDERTRLGAALARAETLANRLPSVEEEFRLLREQHGAVALRAERLETDLKGREEFHEARLEELRGLKRELEDRFAALASGVLSANSASFLELVSERFALHKVSAEEDLAKRQQAITDLVSPLSEKLAVFDQKAGEIEKARSEAYGAITAQVMELSKGQQSLGQETRKLVQALRAPKTRGRWGEMQLRQVFEMAGMAQHVDFLLESNVTVDGERRRPDAIVNIPGGKHIVVDAKTPLEGYLDALEAATPEDQQQHLQRHAQQVRSHVRLLSSKAYHDALQTTPDFVVMFIPGETFVSAAVEVDPKIIEDAFGSHVLIATPTTLMALVKAIAYGWQQEKMAENAAEVQAAAREIYDRLAIFAEHLKKVGRSLGQSVETYNKAVGSLEGRVLVSARRFQNLGVVPAGTSISGPEVVEHEPRGLTAAEFASSPDLDGASTQ